MLNERKNTQIFADLCIFGTASNQGFSLCHSIEFAWKGTVRFLSNGAIEENENGFIDFDLGSKFIANTLRFGRVNFCRFNKSSFDKELCNNRVVIVFACLEIKSYHQSCSKYFLHSEVMAKFLVSFIHMYFRFDSKIFFVV